MESVLATYEFLWTEYKHVKDDLSRKGYDDFVKDPKSLYYNENNGRAKNIDWKYIEELKGVISKIHRDFIIAGRFTGESIARMIDFLVYHKLLKVMKEYNYTDEIFHRMIVDSYRPGDGLSQSRSEIQSMLREHSVE